MGRRAGSPAPGAGHPEARADLPPGARRAGARRGRRGEAGAPPGPRRAVVTGGRGRGTAEPGVPDTPAIPPGASQSRDRETRPRFQRSRPFSSPPCLRLLPHLSPRTQVTSLPRSFLGRGGAGRRSRPAHVLTVCGGGRGAPGAVLENLGWTATPSSARAPGGRSRARSPAPAAGRIRRPQQIPATSLPAAPTVNFHSRPGSGEDRTALPSPHQQVHAATRVPAVPGSVVGCHHGNGCCPDGAWMGRGGEGGLELLEPSSSLPGQAEPENLD